MLMQIFYLVLGLAAVYLYFRKTGRKLKGNVLDGPKGLPLLGSILEINDRNIFFKMTEYAGQFGKIFRLKMLMNNVVVLNSEDIIRKAFGSEDYKRLFNDRAEMFYSKQFPRYRQQAAFIAHVSDPYFKKAKKGMMKALNAYGSGLQDLENNVMVEMDNLLKKIHDKPGKEFECVAMFQRSLSNVISLVIWRSYVSTEVAVFYLTYFFSKASAAEIYSAEIITPLIFSKPQNLESAEITTYTLTGETISDDDPESNLFWEFVHNGDFFLGSQTNSVMITFPFVRFLPGRYRNKYRAARKAMAEIARRCFHDVKKTYVAGEVRGIVDHFLEEQRKERDSNDESFFTDVQIIANIIGIVHAGITTTLTLLANTMLILLNHPQYQTKLQVELDRIIGRERLPDFKDKEHCTFFKAFELEVHRYITVLPLLLPHVCTAHVELEGYDIEEGSTVIANTMYVHHNKEIWGDPWVFRPERFLDEHGDLLPKEHTLMKNLLHFGYGLRLCPGISFARTRYFLYIASLLQHMSFEFPEDKFRPCDPRLSENFEISQIYRALPFFCRFKERL